MSPDALDAYEQDVIAWMELNRRRWEHTRNPIYVWRTISLCFMSSTVRVQALSGLMPPAPGVTAAFLPGWCLEYLGTVAGRIDALSEGCDFRRMPAPFGTLHEASQAVPPITATLSTSEAADLVAQATGIVRGGWNAFDRLVNLESMEADDFEGEALRADGKSARETMDILLQESGLNDERTVRRRITQARKARAKPPP